MQHLYLFIIYSDPNKENSKSFTLNIKNENRQTNKVIKYEYLPLRTIVTNITGKEYGIMNNKR